MGISFTDEIDPPELYNSDANALLVAMLLDQQIPITWAFGGPARLAERLGHFDVVEIAAMDPEAFIAVACRKPAIHRYPAVMGRRVQELCQALVDEYDGDATRIWSDGSSAGVIKNRLLGLPGFGEEKAKILIAVLAKRMGVEPVGWKRASAPFSDNQPRSVADVGSKSDLAAVKNWKAAQRQAGKSKQD